MKIPQRVIPLLVILLLVAVFLIGRYQGQLEILRGGSAPQRASSPTPGTTGQAVPQEQNDGSGGVQAISQDLWQEIIAKPAAARGSEEAPVTMVEFTDYQCPFCARHAETTQPQIESEYIETGKVRYIIRDLPLPIHPNAGAAAQAARCAGDRGKYWEMHDLLFAKQDEWSSGNPDELFASYAGEIGLNQGSFTDCLSGGKYQSAVDEDLALAQRIGARGTPAFIINGEMIIGAQPFAAFQQLIEKSF